MTKFRTYDYTIGMFMQIDPLADIDINLGYSPYHYAFLNPLRYNDPYGDCSDPNDPNCLGNKPTSVDGSLEGSPTGSGGAEFRDDQIVISPISDPVISSEQSDSRVHPVKGKTRPHRGIDIVKPKASDTNGADVVAPANGEIVFFKTKDKKPKDTGNRVRMKGNNGMDFRVFHLQDGSVPSNVRSGAKVKRGQIIGKVGTTGSSTAPHGHFEVRSADGKVQNPRAVIPALRKAPSKDVIRTYKLNLITVHLM